MISVLVLFDMKLNCMFNPIIINYISLSCSKYQAVTGAADKYVEKEKIDLYVSYIKIKGGVSKKYLKSKHVNTICNKFWHKQMAEYFLPRVTQLDAVSLDKEINNILRSSLTEVLQGSFPNLLVQFEPEIDAALSILLWKLSLAKNHATFGQQLLGVKYNVENNKKLILFATVLIGGKYINDRSRNIFATPQQNDKLNKIIKYIRLTIQAASVINTVIFLVEGKYPRLSDRILKLQPVPISKNVSRTVGYTFMTRELLWHGLIELLVFILPLVNYKLIYGQIRSFLIKKQNNVMLSKNPILNTNTRCIICNQSPILPCHINCNHIFCSYCIHASVKSDPKYECPICGKEANLNIQNVLI